MNCVAFYFSMPSTNNCFNLAHVSSLCYPELMSKWISQKHRSWHTAKLGVTGADHMLIQMPVKSYWLIKRDQQD